MPVVRRCPRCGSWHAVTTTCPPRAADLSAWVAGTKLQQNRADLAEASEITRWRLRDRTDR